MCRYFWKNIILRLTKLHDKGGKRFLVWDWLKAQKCQILLKILNILKTKFLEMFW